MSHTSTLPLDVESLTAEWFTQVFGRQVTKVTLVDHHYGTTGRAIVDLEGEEGVPGNVFVKLAPRDEAQRELISMNQLGATEAKFYRDIAPHVAVRVPKSWYSALDETRYIMVLENLALAGCRFPTVNDPDIEDRVHNIVEELAKLHGPFWGSERFASGGDLNWLVGLGVGGGWKYMKLGQDVLRDHMDDDFQRIMDLYLKYSREIVQLWRGGVGTLIHGDCHMGNLFVDPSNRTGFFDWALVNCSAGMRDVTYNMCQTLEPEPRRRLERGLIERYRELLAEQGVKLDAEQAWDQHRLFAIYAWMSTTTTAAMGSKWQDFDLGLTSTKRTTAACLELDSFGLIEKLLA